MSEFAGNNSQTKRGWIEGLRHSAVTTALVQSMSAHGLLIGLVSLYFVGYLFLQQFYLDTPAEHILVLFGGLLLSTSILTIVSLFFQILFKVARTEKPKSPVLATLKGMWKLFRDPKTAFFGFPVLVLMIPFSFVYAQIKGQIPSVVPFSWDKYFYELDKTMHFGTNPWEFLHPFFSLDPYLVTALNFNYNLWFFVMWMVFVYFAFLTKNPVLRTRFFLSFFLIWSIGGSLLAIVFSSAGPAFYSRLGLTPDAFGPLMAYLREVNETIPVWAVNLQDTMWEAYNGKGIDVGISAMPSMHNASTLLFFIAFWQQSRKVGYWLAGHWFLIFIGSIYLGWHYAVDAYFAWAITLVAWYISGRVAKWWHARPAIKEFHDQLLEPTKAV